jgi:hypothetical protein
MEFRILAAREQLKCGREEASDYIEKVDKKRQKWARSLYGVDWDEPSLYDVVLNLDRVTIDNACLAIARMVDLGDFQVTPASHKAQEDLLLGSAVWIALAKDDRTKTAFVNVVADGGKVAIKGHAGSGKIIDAISLVARGVQGVQEVTSEVGVGSDWYW